MNADEKQRAKEEYLRALQEQRSRAAAAEADASVGRSIQPGPGPAGGAMSAAEKREKMLEERRRQFFERKNSVQAPQPTMPSNGFPTSNGSMPPSSQIDHSQMPNFQPNKAIDNAPPRVQSSKRHTVANPFAENEIRPSDWKAKGYPSEYAYVQAMGLLNVKPPQFDPPRDQQQSNQLKQPSGFSMDPNLNKPFNSEAPAAEYGAPASVPSLVTAEKDTDRDHAAAAYKRKQDIQKEYAQQLNEQMERQVHQQQERRASNIADAASNGLQGLGLNIGGASDDREAKRMKQAEFAQELNKDQQRNQHQHRDDIGQQTFGHEAPVGGVNSNQAASGTDMRSAVVEDEATVRRRNQQEYAQQLQQQQQVQQQQQHRQQSPAMGALGLNIGVVDDKESKRRKQEDYARHLNQDRLKVNDKPHGNAIQQDSNNQFPGGGGVVGVGGAENMDAAALRKQHQMEYAQQLQQQQQTKQQQQQQLKASSGGLGLNIGAVDDKESRRRRQADFARELDHDNQLKRFGGNNNNRGVMDGHHAQGGLAAPIGGDGASSAGKSEAQLRRQHQQEYAQQLQQAGAAPAMQLNKFGELEQRRGHQQRATVAAVPSGGIAGIGAGEDPGVKRARQAQYARELQQQQLFHQQQQQHQAIHGSDMPRHGGKVADADTGEGWIIGPLGLPVRKTLDVGNRAAQKAYQSHLSPTKLNMGDQNIYGSNNPYGSHNSNNPYAAPIVGGIGLDMNMIVPGAAAGYVGMPAVGIGGAGPGVDGMVGVGAVLSPLRAGENLDERELRAKQLRAEQAKVLEAQIRDNKERQAAEKRKRDEEEMREMQRLDRERREIQEAFENEQKERKLKVEEDNKKELEKQIELKRQMKEQEALAEKQRVEKEDARIRQEQESLRKRQQDELQREAAEEANKHLQQQQPHQHQQQQPAQMQHSNSHASHASNMSKVSMHSAQSGAEMSTANAGSFGDRSQAPSNFSSQVSSASHLSAAVGAVPSQHSQQSLASQQSDQQSEQESRLFATHTNSDLSDLIQQQNIQQNMHHSPSVLGNNDGVSSRKASLFDPLEQDRSSRKASLFDPPDQDSDSASAGANSSAHMYRDASSAHSNYSSNGAVSPHKQHVEHVLAQRISGDQQRVQQNSRMHRDRLVDTPPQSPQRLSAQHSAPFSPGASQHNSKHSLFGAADDTNLNNGSDHTHIHRSASADSTSALNLNLQSLKKNISDNGSNPGSARGMSARTGSRNRSRAVPQEVAGAAATEHSNQPSSVVGSAHQYFEADSNSTQPYWQQLQQQQPPPHHQHQHYQQQRQQWPQFGEYGHGEYNQNAGSHWKGAGDLNASGRLDKTLEFESKFMMPDGSFLETAAATDKRTRTPETPWGKGDNAGAGIGFGGLDSPSVGLESSPVADGDAAVWTDNFALMPQKSAVNGARPPSGKTRHHPPLHHNHNQQQQQQQHHNQQQQLYEHQDEADSSETKALIEDFQDTLQLLQTDDESLSSKLPAAVDSNSKHSARGQQQQRPGSSDSVTSELDVSKVMRKNRRKWQLLQKINGINDGPEMDVMLDGMQDINSRPTTTASTRPSSNLQQARNRTPQKQHKHNKAIEFPSAVGMNNFPALALHSQEDDGSILQHRQIMPQVHSHYTQAQQQQQQYIPALARKNSAELARNLGSLNSSAYNEPPQRQPAAPRPYSGRREQQQQQQQQQWDAEPQPLSARGLSQAGVQMLSHKQLSAHSAGASHYNHRYSDIQVQQQQQHYQEPDYETYSDYGL